MRPILVFPAMSALLLVEVAAAQPAASRRPIELGDYYRLETAAAPAISPDGSRVAFVRTYVLEAENRRHSEIWLAPSEGGPAIRLTSPAFSANAPRFSPDGALLAFSSRRKLPGSDEAASVWFLRLDQPGGEAFQIPGVDRTPVFSRDGRWIAFTRETPPAPPARAIPAARPAEEVVSDFERKVQERFKGRIFDWMQYRVDGRGYRPDPRDPTASPPEELYLVAREGGTARRLTGLGVDVRDPEFSPDGQSLVVVANAHQRDEHTYERSDLWIVSLDGRVRRLTDDGFDHREPAWSPDGKWLAFTRQQGLSSVIARKQTHGGPVDLFVMPAGGGPSHNLTAGWDLRPGAPRFSPDGRFLYFTAGTGGRAHLFRVATAGGKAEQVTQGERRLTGVTFSASFQRMAYLSADLDHPAEVMIARLPESQPPTDERRLSHLNDGLLGQLALARTERIAYRSRDGTPIEGWVVLPPGYDASRRYPLILSIHGGPHGAYGTEFSFLFQLLAAQGYLVVYTNPRGSTGYGERFLWATWGGWGNLDSEDVLAGVDHAIARYAVDRKRLGVTGYSYGGFLTNWLVATSNRFAAAAAGAGPSSWISDFATSDIPRTKESEFHGGPWEARARDTMVRQSPVTRLARASTPTLFIHGESDYRVPIEQAEQMYLALKKLRVPTRFVRYPDTSHGDWSPWNTVHRYQQELRWWRQYLKGGPAVAGAETKGELGVGPPPSGGGR